MQLPPTKAEAVRRSVGRNEARPAGQHGAPYREQQRKRKLRASLLARMLQHEEHELLQLCKAEVEAWGLQVNAFIFDGMLVRTPADDGPDMEALLSEVYYT